MGYNVVIFFVKLSLFILYFNLFGVSRRIKVLIGIGIGATFTVYTGTTIVDGVFCFPRTGESWAKAIAGSRCDALSWNMTYIVGSFGVISDFYILGLPIPLILRMNLPRKKKIGVCALFMTGFLYGPPLQCSIGIAEFWSRACISSILGLYFRIRASKSQDRSWDLAFTGIIVYEFCSSSLIGAIANLYSGLLN